MLQIVNDQFPLRHPVGTRDVKDPCLVYDGERWHIFGSGGTVTSEQWGVYHLVADDPWGYWHERPPIVLDLGGRGVAAPGVIYDRGQYHMFIQTEFMHTGGRIVHLVSFDSDHWFEVETALESIPGTAEAGIYDPHPALIAGEPVLVYSAFPDNGRVQPDLFLAKPTRPDRGWRGPWTRCGRLLDHAAVEAHHNQPDDPHYEWGLEGGQLVELADGRILLTGVCFLPGAPHGSRQRVFTAISDTGVDGPYRTLGVTMPETVGENGHATMVVQGDDLLICYQRRVPETKHQWRYGLARAAIPAQRAA